MNMQQITEAILSRRHDLSNEKLTQKSIEDALLESGILYEREAKLAPGSIIDFLIGDVGVEVKIKGPARQIYRQLVRYCESGKIKALILVTGKSMGLPQTISGISCQVVTLGASWL